MKNSNLNKITLLTLFISFQLVYENGRAQSVDYTPKSFEKIIVSPKIDLELVKGSDEHVSVDLNGLEKENLEVKVKGKTLHIYLKKAKINEKRVTDRYRYAKIRRPRYPGVRVKAVVTFNQLRNLEIRGDQQVVCDEILTGKKIKIKQYGESSLKLAGVEADHLKVSLYGENELKIASGKASTQIVKSLGENWVDNRNLNSLYTKTSCLGVNHVRVNTTNHLKIFALGESRILFKGNPDLSYGLVLGENIVSRMK